MPRLPLKVELARNEALRFLDKIENLQERMRIEAEKDAKRGAQIPWFDSSTPCKERSAMKRASLDLSRALTEMRKP